MRRPWGGWNAAVVELVQGIAVVKAFATPRPRGEFRGLHDAWVRPIAHRSALAELACSPR